MMWIDPSVTLDLRAIFYATLPSSGGNTTQVHGTAPLIEADVGRNVTLPFYMVRWCAYHQGTSGDTMTEK